MKRIKKIVVYVSDKERKTLEQNANALGLSISMYIRHKLIYKG